MSDEEIIAKTAAFVRSSLKNAEGGHDWWHVERVWKNARTIVEQRHRFMELYLDRFFREWDGE